MGSALRSVLNFVFAIVWTFLCFVVVSLALLVPPRGVFSNRLVRRLWVAGTLKFCGIRVVASGAEGLRLDRPCLMMSNHLSHIDIMAIFASNPVNLRFVAKHTLFFIPCFGWYLWWAGYIPVNRGNRESAIRSLDRAADKIRHGISVVTFPEGTRSPDGRIHEFKKGPFMMALKAGVPVVPVSILGSEKVLPKKSLRLRAGTVYVHYGQPLDITGYTPEDRDRLMAEVHRRISENQAELAAHREKQGETT